MPPQVDIIPRADDGGGGGGRRRATASRHRRRRDGTPLSPEPPLWRFINEAKKLTLHRRSLLLPRSATTMWSPASGCRSLPPPLIILPPPRRVWVTTATTMMKRTSRCRERGRTPMGEDADDPIMTAWHRIGGSRRHPTPKPMVVGQHHRTSDKRGRGGGGFHIQRSRMIQLLILMPDQSALPT